MTAAADTPAESKSIFAQDVRVLLDGTVVLEAVSLQVEPGEIVALQGTSGSGKTTFLHAIAGFVPLTSGHITINDVTLTNSTESERASSAPREMRPSPRYWPVKVRRKPSLPRIFSSTAWG
jgi:ABC-type Fe3+/spermidine/putrescine transport system ATPase subunit